MIMRESVHYNDSKTSQTISNSLRKILRCCLVISKVIYSAGFNPSILRHSIIWGTADKAALNRVKYLQIWNLDQNVFKKCFFKGTVAWDVFLPYHCIQDIG